jgi:DNA modification methylase
MVKLNHVECIDCLECLKTVPDDFVDLIVTDPPYNVSQKTNPAPRLSKTNFVFANKYIAYAINEKGRPSDSLFNFKKQNEMHNTIITSALQGKERLKENRKTIHPTQKSYESEANF